MCSRDSLDAPVVLTKLYSDEDQCDEDTDPAEELSDICELSQGHVSPPYDGPGSSGKLSSDGISIFPRCGGVTYELRG